MKIIYVVGNKSEFLQWCRRQGVTNCVTAGVHHLPSLHDARGCGPVPRDHLVVLLPSADLGTVLYLRGSREFKVPPDPKADRRKSIQQWTRNLDKWMKLNHDKVRGFPSEPVIVFQPSFRPLRRR